MESILHFDYLIFEKINGTWHHPFLDSLMPIWREKTFWVPFYLFLVVFVWQNFRQKAWAFFLTIAIMMTVSDTVSSKILKKTIQRPRPCKTEMVEDTVRLLRGCSGSYSMPSSHAFNHFCIAFFLIGTLGRLFRWIRIPLFLWAVSIAYGQVYVGVHFPTDVTMGAILGTCLGLFTAFLYNKKWQLSYAI